MDIGDWNVDNSYYGTEFVEVPSNPTVSTRSVNIPPPLELSQSPLSADNSLEQQFSPLFPHNPSLAEELARLFVTALPEPDSPFSTESQGFSDVEPEDFMDDFRHNGRDFEYCPELDNSGKLLSLSSRFPFYKRRNNKRPLANECVFCKNNGEEDTFYKAHILKDRMGRVTCPILRNYTCPICGTSGDFAHTIKYCPENKNQELTPVSIAALKVGRASSGKIRKPTEFFANSTKSFRSALIQNTSLVQYGPPQPTQAFQAAPAKPMLGNI